MALCNAALEQLVHKIKEEGIITVGCKWRGCYMGCHVCWTKTTVTLTYSVLFYIPRTPSAPGCQDEKARELWHPQPRDETAVLCDRKGARRGTGQSWHGQQCCQEAPRNGFAEELPDEAVDYCGKISICRLMSDICFIISKNIVKYYEIILHHNL